MYAAVSGALLLSPYGVPKKMTAGTLERQLTTLGSRARITRVARLMTQQELAESAGVSPEDVSLLERGEKMSPETARRLMIYLGIAGAGEAGLDAI
jgi:DNA-binding XRE family transcriptional regulator